MVTAIIVSAVLGFAGGVVCTVLAAKAGWIQPSNVK
jgi:hypothetical protein